MTARPLDQEWFTARELAALKLRDLPTDKSGMIKYAARNGWNDDPYRCRNRIGRGGGLEYHLSLIPTLAWADYHQRTMTVGAVEPIRPQPVLPTPETERGRRAQAARLAILAACERYTVGSNLGRDGGVHAFAMAYNFGQIAVDDWVRQEVPKTSHRTLFRWIAAAKEGQSLGVDRAQNRKGKGLLETANAGRAKMFILGLIAHQPSIKAERVQALLSDEMGGQLVALDGTIHPIPPVRTIQHQIKLWRVSETVALTKLSDPDRYRSTMAPSGVGMLRHVTAPNQLWMIDSSPLDAMDTTISRPTVYACVDIGTRRMILYVSRTPRAAAVAMLLRKAILAWGVPQKIKTDNGSDFVAEDTQRLLAALKIEMELSDAYTPTQKGHVERAIGTMQHGLVELLPGYIGHGVAERKRLEDRKSFAQRLGAETAELFGIRYTLAEIQTAADRWIDVVYSNTVHSALNGKTPAQAAREANVVVRTVDERALDVLLMPVAKGGYRKVTKFGVRLGDAFYQTIAAFPGDRVFVRLDPTDLGIVYLFAEDTGAYVELAVCPELRGIDPAEYTRMVKERRAALLKSKTDPIRAEVRQLTTGAPMIERYLNEKERQLREAEATTADVIQLPPRTVEHMTPDLAAALTAATGETPAIPAEPVLSEAAPAEILTFQPRAAAGTGRPSFKTDQEMAGWLIANPTAMTERDRALMAERLRSWTFRELCAVSGVDVDALSTLIKTSQEVAKT